MVFFILLIKTPKTNAGAAT